MNPPVPPGPEPDPDPPGPGPDPPTPVTTYSFTANLSYDAAEAGIGYTLTLSYKATSESSWVTIDSANLTSKASGGTDTAVLRNIPQGCYSVKVAISTTAMASVYIKNAGSSWVTELTYGSGNEGWNQDYDSNIAVQIASYD